VSSSDGKGTNRVSPVLEANDSADDDDESEISCTFAKKNNS
jgi:hypothetical protein